MSKAFGPSFAVHVHEDLRYRTSYNEYGNRTLHRIAGTHKTLGRELVAVDRLKGAVILSFNDGMSVIVGPPMKEVA